MESTPDWQCHAYGRSKSGKTVYVVPVLVLGPSEDRPETHSRVHTFFMHPAMSPPMGELNGVSEVWTANLYSLDVLWDGLDQATSKIQAWSAEQLIESGLPLVFQSGKIPPLTERAQREASTN